MDNKSPVKRSDRALNVVIIGGSLAGLMHGIMLKRLGHNVHILERALSSIRENQAAGITAGPHVQAFCKDYDTFDTPWFSSSPGAKVLDEASKVRIYREMDNHNTSWDVLYYRMRAIFDAFESEYCPEPPLWNFAKDNEVLFDGGKRVTGVLDTDTTVTVEYEDLINGVDGRVSADLVILAGGASCDIRSMLLPDLDLQRPYSGYLTWRGTVPESDVSEETKRTFGKENTLYIGAQSYIVIYTIPGVNGNLNPGECIFNLAWYCNYPEDALTNILTDVDGHKHQHSLPTGKMRDEVWSTQKALAAKLLPPPFLELINKIQQPFVTVISDTTASKASFFNGKLLLVGDALTLFRPHNALSSNQAAFDCLQLQRVLQGDITISEWEVRVLQYAQLNRLRAISWGAYFQVGWLAYFTSEIYFRSELVRQWLKNRWNGRE
ncbi:MAG: hypothetical protein ASARMPREDX12_003384 [Alectoria sarmentosa]|nr:MAG: hypothetical protein ASARMPREDX12_003384 [Alectoria sarmentosa]